MSRELRDILLKRRDQALVDAVKRRRESIDTEFVFPSKAGTVLDITNLVPRHFLPLLNRVGLRRIRFHDLRHTFGSLLIEAGAPLTYVRDQMGHSSIKVTVDTYGHMVPGSNVRYIDRLDNRETSPPKNANPAQTRGGGPMRDSLQLIEKNGAPGETRTPDLQIRSLPLYPTELQARAVPVHSSILPRRRAHAAYRLEYIRGTAPPVSSCLPFSGTTIALLDVQPSNRKSSQGCKTEYPPPP